MSSSVQKVEFKSAPNLVVFVRALNALEGAEFSTTLHAAEKTKDILAVQLVTFVCKEDGSTRFADQSEAFEFMRTIRPGQLNKIIETARKFNELSDEAIEEELKN